MPLNRFSQTASAAILAATTALAATSPVTAWIIAPVSAESVAHPDAEPLDVVDDSSPPPNADLVRSELAGLLAIADRPPTCGDSRERRFGRGDHRRLHEDEGTGEQLYRRRPPHSQSLFAPFDEEDEFESGGTDEHCETHELHGSRWLARPGPAWHDSGPMKAFLMALDHLDDLIDFYEEQDRIEDMEQALRKRVQMSMKFAELHTLAQHMGPDAAIREYYCYVDRPDRALEHDLQRTEQEIQETTELMGDLHTGIARLTSRHEMVEQHRRDLEERRRHLHGQLLDLHARREAEYSQELIVSAECNSEEITRLSNEVESITKTLADKRISEERRQRLGDRRDDLSRELRDLKSEQAEVRVALEQHRKEATRLRDRERREEEAGAHEELRRLEEEKWAIHSEQSRHLQWMDQRAAEIEHHMKEIKAFLLPPPGEAKVHEKPDKPGSRKVKGSASPGKKSQSAEKKKAHPTPKKAPPTKKKSPKPEKPQREVKEKAVTAKKADKKLPKTKRADKKQPKAKQALNAE